MSISKLVVEERKYTAVIDRENSFCPKDHKKMYRSMFMSIRPSKKRKLMDWLTKGFFIFLVLNLESAKAMYKVAVFDHHSLEFGLPDKIILKNVEIFKNQITRAADRGVEMIVFPEYGLTPVNANPEKYAIDISANDIIIKEFQSQSKEQNMYIVLNILEKSIDIDNAIKYYNTDLVFDRNGNIIARYRKINLSPQEKANKLTPGNEIITFKTDFEVTFGLLNFHDIFFDKPAKEVLSNEKVTEIVVPTAWKSSIPFQMSSSLLHAYSAANYVDVIAAGYKNPTHEYYGGGIFTIKNDTKAHFVKYSTNSMLTIKDIPRRGLRRSIDQHGSYQHSYAIKKTTSYVVLNRQFEANKYFFKPIDFSRKQILEDICHGYFCCTFNITISESNVDEIFKLMIYDGFDELGEENIHLRICSLLACENDANDSCGTKFGSNVTFTQIKISTFSKKTNAVFYTPNTLTHDLQPIQDLFYFETNTEDGTKHTVTTFAPQSIVLAFGLWSRVDEEKEDIEENTTPGSTLKLTKSSKSTEGVSSSGNTIPNVILLLLLTSFSSVFMPSNVGIGKFINGFLPQCYFSKH